MIDNIISIYKRNEKLIKDNIYLASGILAFGLAGYFFHFYAGRKLGPEDYGTLGAMLSILYIATIFTLFIQLAITKIVSNLHDRKEEKKITYILKHNRIYWIYGIISAAAILAATPILRYYLGIQLWIPFLIIAAIMTYTYILSLNMGVMQGLQNFKQLAAVYWSEGIGKIAAGVILIGIGLGVSGGVSAFGIAYLIGLIATVLFLTKLKKNEEEKFQDKTIKRSLPLLIVLFSLSLMYSIDVILVKHYLQNAEVGFYTALSTIGKVIFFASNSVSFVMFPKISETKTEKENKNVLYKSLLLILLISTPIILFYASFPSVVTGLLFGNQYAAINSYIYLFGIVMALYALIYTFCFYNLSLNKTKFIYILLISNVAQIIGIIMFHESIKQVVYVMLAFMALLLASLFMIKERKNETPLTHHTSLQ